MVDCVKVIYEAIEKHGLRNLPPMEIRRRLRGLDIPRECKFVSLKVVKQALAYRPTAETATVLVERPVSEMVGSPDFPDYTLAELIYIGLYEAGPADAHERMYLLLEPVVLGFGVEARLFFLPLRPGSYAPILSRFAELYQKMPPEWRETVCSSLRRTFRMITYSFNPVFVRGRACVKLSIPEPLMPCTGVRKDECKR